MAVLLAHEYASAGASVAVLDLDPQATTSRVLDAPAKDLGQALGAALYQGDSLCSLLQATPTRRIQLVQSGEGLSLHESRIASDPLGLTLVAQSVASLSQARVDLVLVDTPPSLGPFTFGALAATQWALLPTACEDASVQALPTALNAVSRARQLNHELALLAVVPNRFEVRTRHGVDVLGALRSAFGDHVTRTAVPKAAAISRAMRPLGMLEKRSRASAVLAELAGELQERLTSQEADARNQPAGESIVSYGQRGALLQEVG